MATLKELTDGLVAILKDHPELADKEVIHASECGYSGAGFESPIQIAVPVPTSEYVNENFPIRIVSDDDGYRTSGAVADWKFISSEKENDNVKDTGVYPCT